MTAPLREPDFHAHIYVEVVVREKARLCAKTFCMLLPIRRVPMKYRSALTR